MNDIGSRIVSRRKELGLKGRELAERVGCHPPDISDWEKGKNLPSVESLIKLARSLKTTETWLVSGKDPAISEGMRGNSKITQLPVDNKGGGTENRREIHWEGERIRDKNLIIDLQKDKIATLMEKIRNLESRLAELEGQKSGKSSQKLA